MSEVGVPELLGDAELGDIERTKGLVSGGDEIPWPCECPLCRLLVTPMLRFIYRKLVGSHVETKVASTIELPEENAYVDEEAGKAELLNEEEKAGVMSGRGSGEELAKEQEEISGEEEREEPREEAKQYTVVKVDEEVLSRVEALEKEVEKVKENVRKSIEYIKATLVDLRAAVAEISNPFNIMRKYAELFNVGEQQPAVQRPAEIAVPTGRSQVTVLRPQGGGSAPVPEEVPAPPIAAAAARDGAGDHQEPDLRIEPQGGETGRGDAEKSSDSVDASLEDLVPALSLQEEEGSASTKKGEELSEEQREEEEVEKKVHDLSDEHGASATSSLGTLMSSGIAKKLGLGRLIKLLKWIDEMLDRVPKESIEEVARFAAIVGVIGEEEKDFIFNAIDFVVKTRRAGLKVYDQLMALYMLAKVFGVEDKEADNEVVKLAVDRDDKFVTKFIKP